MDRMPMQTLQIYRKKEIIPSGIRIKKMMDECEKVRLTYTLTPELKGKTEPEEKKKIVDQFEPPRVRTIEFQNTLMALEKKLVFWTNDYRSMIDQLRELERLQPKCDHEVEESDQQAQDNVDKIITVEEIKDELLSEFSNLCIRHEIVEEKSRRQIKRLESNLAGALTKIENMEYDLKKLKNRRSFV